MASSDYLTNRSRLLDTRGDGGEWFGDYSSHGKAALIDDLAVVGSYNFDMRSTYLDTEMMLVFYGDAFYDLLEANLMEMEAQCLQVSEEGYLPRAGVEPKTYGPSKSIPLPRYAVAEPALPLPDLRVLRGGFPKTEGRRASRGTPSGLFLLPII
ncbi:MAG: phospholipase D-like domain-containing protein [Intestinimonas sp.]